MSEKLIPLSSLKKRSGNENYIVEGIITKGLTILGGIPKSGKTFLALQMSTAIAMGKEFLGKRTKKGSVVYLAFEDPEEDIDARFNQFGIDKNLNINFRFGSRGNYFRLEKYIKVWKEENPDLLAIFVDTYGKYKETNTDKPNYQDDYRQASEIRELALEHGVAIILLHHMNKNCNKNSPFEAYYGTNGLPAAADNMIVLYRENIMFEGAELMITGKSIPVRNLQIRHNERMMWEQNLEEQDDGLDINIAKVINYISKEKKFNGTANELCSRLGLVIYPNQLSSLLNKNNHILSNNNVQFIRGKGKVRWLELTLKSDEGDDETMN
ncbi:MAG: AAA family ATPase [Longicatena sp.]|uniref:AAA family ATPase n=1 Tax=Anaerorhabdus sp. TaxID=1872524 RepID=UPI002FC7789B